MSIHRFITILILASATLVATAQTRYDITHVHDSINTPLSETGAVVVSDSVLLYTTMSSHPDNSMYIMQFGPTLTHIFQAPILPDGSLGGGQACNWGFNAPSNSSGNVAYDRKNDVIYFTRSENRDQDKKIIYYSRRSHGRWSKPQPLGGNVNLKGYTSTHPTVGYLPSGEPILYFISDRPGGMGGLDIWYSAIIRDGLPGNCINLGAPVNTDSNEVTPFYCAEEGTLYFSSNREGGLGGYDVYQSHGYRNTWELPQTLGPQINSRFDDVYFSTQPCSCRCQTDTNVTDEILQACGFLSSNRPGSLFESDSNCCNDLFRWRRWVKNPEATPDTMPRKTTTVRNALDLIPLTLYFHNDEPNPRSLDTTTHIDYAATYKRYMPLRDEYKGAQPSPVDRRKWDSIQKSVDYFFDNELKLGYDNLMLFLDLLYADLRAGKHITLTINGFASPLFESLYNVNISKRRIDSFRNTLKRWNDEALLPYLNNGMLQLKTVANGAPNEEEVAVSDPLRDPRSEKSVYSMSAAHARRIEIIEYQITK